MAGRIATGVAVLAGVLVIAAAGTVLWIARARAAAELAEKARAEREERVAEEARPLEEALAVAEAAAAEPYDIEKTMRVLFEVDTSVHRVSSIREYLDLLGRADYRRVKPEVLASRKKIVDVLLRYYAVVETLEEQEALLETFTRAVDSLSSVQEAKLAFAPGGGFLSAKRPDDVARANAEDARRREAERQRLREHIHALESELAGAIEAASPVFADVRDEWARLCLQRDRAYLNALEGRFEEARAAAEAALELAPFDEESQLLRALALVEGAPVRREVPVEVDALLGEFLSAHPDSAPALLMRGVWRVRNGQADEGRVDLELAASRYPQQAQVLADRLDPYRMRSYLAKTSQGVRISGMYRAMMVGACWFSPELQLARLDFDAGETERGVARVRDHFARRRAQGQWDLILYDVQFCEELLGESYRAIFPESPYLDLEISGNVLGGSALGAWVGVRDVDVVVENRSDVALHNAALVLCVRFTDMQPEDFVPITAGRTVPLVAAVSRTGFGSVDLRHEWDTGGAPGASKEKGSNDVVPPVRAVVVADEGVFRVDTVEYKLETLERYAPLDAGAPGEGTPPMSLSALRRRAVEALRAGPVEVERVVNRVFADDLRLSLPREVAVLGPMFRLEVGASSFEEGKKDDVSHRIEGDRVALTFEGAGQLLAPEVASMRLIARSTLGSVVAVLARDETGAWRVASVE